MIARDPGVVDRVTPPLARNRPRHSGHRWRAERSLSWLSCYRRLQVRWDRSSGRYFAFVEVACSLLCFKDLRQQP